MPLATVPVLFHLLRPAGGSTNAPVDADFAALITYLNQLYLPANIAFEQIGFINLVDCNTLYDNSAIFPNYSYLPNALNIFVYSSGGTMATPFSQNPTLSPMTAQVTYDDIKVGKPRVAHEIGHMFSLLHTHGQSTSDYHYPAQPGQYDYPDPNVNLLSTKRELVIRPSTPQSILDTKIFTKWNCDKSGDLCCDTEAACAYIFPKGYPASDAQNLTNCETFPFLNCLSGCPSSNNFVGTYRDYNFDPITPQLDNLMSYYNQLTLTTCQYDRVAFNYENFRKAQLKDGSINYNDHILCEYNAFPVKNVMVYTTHATDARYSISTTRSNGAFQGHLFDTKLKANVRKIGSTVTTATPAQPVITDAYTQKDWLEGIDIDDVAAITKHVLNVASLPDGFKKIAADVNLNGQITTFDAVELRKLILGIYTALPNATQPWRFVPDFIPGNFGTDFDANPFNVNIGSSFVSANQYTSPNWEYDVANLPTGMKGYRGVKIGNAYGVCLSQNPPALTTIDGTSSFLFESGKDYELSFNVNNFQQKYGFQFGLKINPQLFDIISVNLGNLTTDFSIEDNVGTTKMSEGILKLLWLDPNLVSKNLTNGSSIIKVLVHAKGTAFASEHAYELLDADDFSSIFLGTNGSNAVGLSVVATEVQQVSGRENNQKSVNAPSDFGISPNPFTNTFNLRFFAEAEADGQILVRSTTTGAVNLNKVHFVKGVNVIEVLPANMSAGLYSVELFDGTKWHFGKAIKM